MRDIHISAARQAKELCYIILCLVIAIITNIIAIIIYQTDFSEIYTQWMWQLLLAGGLYALSLVIRIPFIWLFSMFKPSKKEEATEQKI